MKKALIVGINEYKSAPLTGCINDANAVAELLGLNEDGTRNFDVRTATSIKTRGGLIKNIKDLFDGGADTVLFYYSGHGYSSSDLGGYLVTPDASQEEPGVSMDAVMRLADNSKAKNIIIILDCCHAGYLGTLDISGVGHAQIREGVTILAASRSDESSVEVDGHGVFTNLLTSALEGGAADISGNITPGSIYSYIDQALGPWDQRPVFKTNVSQFLSIRKTKASIPDESVRKLTAYFSRPDQQLDLNPSFEYTNSPQEKHMVVEPYADSKNVAIFKDLQKYARVGLVEPVDAEHMYYAAMNNKACKLTALGKHYWRLVDSNRI